MYLVSFTKKIYLVVHPIILLYLIILASHCDLFVLLSMVLCVA